VRESVPNFGGALKLDRRAHDRLAGQLPPTDRALWPLVRSTAASFISPVPCWCSDGFW